MTSRAVSRSRLIHASPEAIFAIVSSPAGHVQIDGSGSVRESIDKLNKDQPKDERISWNTARGALKRLDGTARKKGFGGGDDDGDDGGWEWVPPDGYFDNPDPEARD